MRDIIFSEFIKGLASDEFIERLLFSVVAIGVLLAVGGGWRYVELSNRLSGNEAAQIHEAGGEVALESKGQAHGLMASDIERRRMLGERSQMMVLGGIGLVLVGLGWFLGDIMRGRRRKTEVKDKAGGTPA